MASGEAGAAVRKELWVRVFIAAQVAIPVLATIHRWVTGDLSLWGWQMFAR